MSFVDDTFKTLPAQLLNQFGIDITYIKAASSQTYNATTGEVGGSDTNVSMKALITSVTAREFQSTSQTTDVQIILSMHSMN